MRIVRNDNERRTKLMCCDEQIHQNRMFSFADWNISRNFEHKNVNIATELRSDCDSVGPAATAIIVAKRISIARERDVLFCVAGLLTSPRVLQTGMRHGGGGGGVGTKSISSFLSLL